MNKIKLYCLSYAGGSAMSYFKWRQFLPEYIDVHPLELAGRGKRFQEPLYNSFDDAIMEIYETIISSPGRSPYAIFGHSMGAYLAYEVSYMIMNSSYPNPIRLFISGQETPHEKQNENPPYHTLSDNEFKEKIKRNGGTLESILNDDSLMDVFIPILKADYKMLENYKYSKKEKLLCFPITLLCGIEDELIPVNRMKYWNQYTSKTCNTYYIDGDHFFINTHIRKVTEIINQDMSPVESMIS